MVKSGFKQITQGLLSETFVEAHVCRKLVSFFVCLSPSIHQCIYPSVCLSMPCMPEYKHLYIHV